MPSQLRVVWDPGFTAYNFGPGHPMNPLRLDLTARLCEAMGVFDHDGVEVFAPRVPDDAVLTSVHTADYVAAVRAASEDPGRADPAYGLGTDDDPAFAGMHDASARVVEGTRQVCADVWEGRTQHGVNFCGGLHHAMAGNAAGFCIYNDIAVGIQWLLDHGAQRVAYVDVDVHHGDGVERIFWDDPRVLTISLHESGRALFPGTGFAGDIGGPRAQGEAVNVALPPGTGDSAWLRALHSTALPLVRAFKPDVLVTQHGCDTHAQDPLAHLAMSVDAQRSAADAAAPAVPRGVRRAVGGARRRRLRAGAGRAAELDPPDRDRRAPADRARPSPCRRTGSTTSGRPSVARGRVGWATSTPPPARSGTSRGTWATTPHDEVDRAIMATRQAVFALHGLDVWFD